MDTTTPSNLTQISTPQQQSPKPGDVLPILQNEENSLKSKIPSILQKSAVIPSPSSLFQDYQKTGQPELLQQAGEARQSLIDKIKAIPQEVHDFFAPMHWVRPPDPVQQMDPQLVVKAIAQNETGGVQGDPYKVEIPTNSVFGGKALGKYQVSTTELATYAKRFIGHSVTPQQFLSDPQLQDQYMENKAQYLINRIGSKFGYQGVLAAHRGGFSNFDNIPAQIKQYQGYIDKGMATIQPPEKTN